MNAPTERDVKKLFALSLNQRAFPNCIHPPEQPGGKPRSSASLLLNSADELLMRNRGHLARIHLPLALLNLII